MRSFLLTALRKKFERSSLAAFTQAHAHDWLVWEPGGWSPPSKTTTAGMMARPTDHSLSGEALAVALEPRPDGAPVVIGRANCDFVVNDGTVSQRHLQLIFDTFRWTVADLGSRNGSSIDGLRLREVPKPLNNRAALLIGSVALTYYVPSGMHERLSAKPKR